MLTLNYFSNSLMSACNKLAWFLINENVMEKKVV